MKAYKLSCPNCNCKLVLTIEENKKPVISALNPEPEPEPEQEYRETEQESVIEQGKKSAQLKLFIFDDDEGK